MCRPKKDGGSRCAIHRHDSMAVLKYVTATTNLERSDAEALLTELRVEGRERGSADPKEWSDYLNELKTKSEHLNSTVITKNIQKTLEHHNAPDKGTFYALRQLPERARKRDIAIQQRFREIADMTGRSPEQVRDDYLAAREAVDTSRAAPKPVEFTRANALKYQKLGLPADKSSVVAWERIQERPVDLSPRITPENELAPDDVRMLEPTSDSATESLQNDTSCVPESDSSTIAEDTEVTDRSAEVEDDAAATGRTGSTATTTADSTNDDFVLTDGDEETDSDATVESTSGEIISVGYQREDGRMQVTMTGPDGTPMVMRYRNVSPGLHQVFMAEEFDASFYRVNIMGNPHYQYDDAADDAAAGGSAQCPSCGQFTAPNGHVCDQHREADITTDLTRTRPEVPDEHAETLVHRLDPTLRPVQPLKEISVTDVAGERFADEELFLARVDALTYSIEEDPYAYPTEFVEQLRAASWNDQVIVTGCRFEDDVEPLTAHRGRRADLEPTVVLNVTNSNYRVDAETGLLIERRTYSVSPSDEDGDRDALVDAARQNLSGDPAVDLIPSRDHVKDDVIFDGKVSQIRHVTFPEGPQVTESLQNGRVAAGEVEVRYPTFISTTHDDTGHELPTGMSATVTGVVAMRRESSGLVELDERTTLRCSCDTYARNYDCAHVQHATSHLTNIAEQIQDRALKHPSLTPEFSQQRYVRIEQDDDGNDIAVMGVPLDQKVRVAQSNLAFGWKSQVPVGMFADPERPTLQEMTEHQQVLQAVWDMTGYTVPKDTPLAMASAKNIPVRTPMSATFTENYDTSKPDYYTVTGDVTFTADDDGRAVISDHRLRCDCWDYQKNYDCVHVRAAASQFGYFVALEDPNQPLAGTETSVNDLVYGNLHTKDIYRRAMGIRALMDADEVSYEVAEARYEKALSSKLAAFQKAEEERHVEVNKRRKSDVAPNELNSFRNHTMPEAQRHEEEKQYEAQFQGFRDRLLSRWEDVEPGYTDDPEKFYDHYRAAAKADIPYAYENVFDGSCGENSADRRVGVELEFVLDPKLTFDQKKKVIQDIAVELHEQGLTEDPEQKERHAAKETGYHKWNFEKDQSVDGEVVSPPLDDSPESWKQLEQVCDILKKHGAKANLQCGSHVHVSSGSYGFSTAKHATLYRSVTQNEDVLYRLSTSPQTGIHRGVIHCFPNVVDAEGDIADDVADSHFLFNSRHGEAINFDSSGSDDLMKSHVEFRTWDATLDPAVIQQQMKISVAMMDAAERKTIADGGSKKPDAARARMGDTRAKEKEVLDAAGVQRHTAETFMETNQEFARFLDSHFRTQDQRRGVMALFAHTKWQKSFLVSEAVTETTQRALKRGK